MQEFPFCAETSSQYLVDHFLTPGKEAYVRNHNLVPQFDDDFEQEFTFEIGITSTLKHIDPRWANRQFKQYSLQDIKNMPNPHTVVT